MAGETGPEDEGKRAAPGHRRFASLILSPHSRFNVTCEFNKEEIDHNDDDDGYKLKQIRIEGPASQTINLQHQPPDRGRNPRRWLMRSGAS